MSSCFLFWIIGPGSPYKDLFWLFFFLLSKKLKFHFLKDRRPVTAGELQLSLLFTSMSRHPTSCGTLARAPRLLTFHHSHILLLWLIWYRWAVKKQPNLDHCLIIDSVALFPREWVFVEKTSGLDVTGINTQNKIVYNSYFFSYSQLCCSRMTN